MRPAVCSSSYDSRGTNLFDLIKATFSDRPWMTEMRYRRYWVGKLILTSLDRKIIEYFFLKLSLNCHLCHNRFSSQNFVKLFLGFYLCFYFVF